VTATQATLDSPDAHGQGGIVLEITRDGKTKLFYLDHNKEALPAVQVPYAQQIKRVVAALK
jgi:hypothetical protein